MIKTRKDVDWYGRYDIREKMPISSNLAFYWAIRREDERKVLLRVFRGPFSSVRRMMEKERELMENINSPRMLDIYEIEIYNDKIVSTMDGFGMEPLKTARKKIYPLKTASFLRLSISLVKVAREIYKHGVANHFISSRSVFIDVKTLDSKSVKLKIGNFGVEDKSRSPADDGAGFPISPCVAPEAIGQKEADYRACFYSVGVVFYELLTGVPPFQFENGPEKLISEPMTAKPIPPHERDKKIPVVVSDIVMKLLSASPEKRYQSSCGLIWDLEECLKRLKSGKIEDFKIGRRDISEKFQIAEKLYGRRKHLQNLTKTFEEATLGEAKITLIKGEPGVGKTALVDKFRDSRSVGARGFFIEGKFEFEGGEPYGAVIRALSQLARYILGLPEEIDKWRRRLQDALGDNLQVIIELIPEMEKVVGRQKPSQKLKPEETRNRFLITFHNFLKLFCGEETPLTLFLDDLQRADVSSLDLIQALATSKEIEHFLLIGAYRDNEVSKDHILNAKLREIEKSLGERHSKVIREIHLEPLENSAVNGIIADTLYCEARRSKYLAEEIHKRTAGNPFFVREFLRSLRDDDILSFNYDQGRWTWRLEDINESGVTENVAELLSGNFANLAEDVRKYLKIASCIGDHFSLGMIREITGDLSEDISNALNEAVKREIIIRLKEVDGRISAEERARFKFPHDNLRQNIYSFLTREEERKINSEIGETLLKDDRGLKDKIIDVVRHLNKGRELIDDSERKRELASLNLEASKKAKSSAAYQPALEYIRIAESLLSPDSWEKAYGDVFEIYKEYSECAYICGEFDEAEKQIETLLDHAETNLEKSEVLCMRLIQCTVNGSMEEAIKAGVKALSFLGEELSENPGQALVEKEIDSINRNMAGKYVSELIELPELEAENDEKRKIILRLRILMELSGPSYLMGNLYLCALTAIKMVGISLRHGNHPFSAVGYATYGFLLTSAFGELKLGYEFGRLAVEVNKKNHKKRPELKGRIYFMYSALIRHWNRPWESLKSYFEEARRACLDSGDLFFASYTSNNMYFWDRENSLKVLSKDYVSAVESTKYQYALDITVLMEQFQASLQGKTRGRLSLSDDRIDEEILLERMKKGDFLTGMVEYYMDKAFLCYIYESYDKARYFFEELDKDVRLLNSIYGLPWNRVLCVYRFLVCAASFGRDSKDRAVLEREHRRIKKWSDNCPENFAHFRYLMEAEIARLDGKLFKAAELYKAAAEKAGTNNFPKYEAIANELASKFYIALKDKDNAGSHMLNAIKLYAEWGAVEKVKHLLENYAYLLSLARLEELIDESTKNVMKTTGSQNAYVLLMKNETLDIRPEIKKRLSGSLINFVLNSHQSMFLDVAASKGDFAEDLNINNITSIFCSPILARKEFLGVLYLENPLAVKDIAEEQTDLACFIAPAVERYLKNSTRFAVSDKAFKVMSEIKEALPCILYIDRVKTADCRIFLVHDEQDEPSKILRVSGRDIERCFPKLIKVHKSYIVNLDKISRIRRNSKTKRYEAILDSPRNNKVPVGRKSLNMLRLFYPRLFKSDK